ncbi:MAG: hypothetical protein GX452_09335 [Ignavibacteriales bacterium]|jgi:drug/metabolite transporter (DMT)-like permease|nr:hypothetical protein [Ignavibacteriaceae bacterium]NLH61596.1 hypothetical protein [Ignavibacteriales bacterium]HOJ17202.1 hypothetical protein [Ignavibacteriaceae bacterium]HPO54391.1 hypothetical protein [Ignavibacteriaceae bacterium]
MEWIILFLWLAIINGGLGGQYILNWMGNQPKYVGNQPVGVSAGVMTWWREISKLLWAAVAVIIEIARGKELKYFWPGRISMITIVICAFTGVIENIGFFYLPRNYSPHLYAPYVNLYLAMLPFFGKFLFDAQVRKEHYIGIFLVISGLIVPHIPWVLGHTVDANSVLDLNAIIWIIIINCCLCSQQILNNKTVQTAFKGVGPNALVLWREIWKLLFISSFLLIIPLIATLFQVHTPAEISKIKFEKALTQLDAEDQEFIKQYYTADQEVFRIASNLSEETESKIESVLRKTDHNGFFSLFEGSLFPDNWWPILFVVAAGLTGYIYSFGFFKLSKYSAHYWVPYTNLWLAVLPFVMLAFGKDVTLYQIIGAVIVTAGLIVGVSDYGRHKVEEIEKTHK